MKYLGVGLFIAAVASLEFAHEFVSSDAPGSVVCTAADARPDAIRELLLQHLAGH